MLPISESGESRSAGPIWWLGVAREGDDLAEVAFIKDE